MRGLGGSGYAAPQRETIEVWWDPDTSVFRTRNGAELASAGGSLTILDEGVSQGTATSLDFVGADVAVAVAGDVATVTVTATGSGLEVLDEGVSEGTGIDEIDFAGSGVSVGVVGTTATITIPGATVDTSWQTYTPNVSALVDIDIDFDDGPNVILESPVDDTQVVNVPANMPDGAEMEIDLVGGDGSGAWVTWSAGAPATPGFVFLVSGVAPTANASATMYTPCYVKRYGVKYRVVVGSAEVL